MPPVSRLIVLAGFVCLAAFAGEPAVNLTPGPKASPQLIEAVLRADQEFFAAVFDTCDIAVVRRYVTDDFEFFHDKWGLIDTSGAQFVEDIEGKCQRQRDGTSTDGTASTSVLPRARARGSAAGSVVVEHDRHFASGEVP